VPGWLTRSAAPALFSLILLVPHFYSSPTWDGASTPWSHWGLPLLYSGDEPHYLVYANSLFRDGDFDLSNNYHAALAGEYQAGRIWASRILDHHTVYYIRGDYTLWADLYELSPGGSGQGWKIVPKSPDHRLVEGDPEYGFHPPGIALILTALFKPFGDPEILESGGLLVSGAMLILGMLAFRSIIRGLGAGELSLNVITAIVFLGTPIWHYGRTLYSESFTLGFSLSAFALYIGSAGQLVRGGLLPGALMALAIIVRPVSVLLCLPLAVELLAKRRFAQLFALALAPSLAVLFLLYLNHMMFGSPLHFAQVPHWGNPLDGLSGILFSLSHGLVPLAPATLVALALWPSFLARHRRIAWLSLAMILPSLLLISCWQWWGGGTAYGPRLIVPLIPFLFISLAQIDRNALLRPSALRDLAALLCTLSIFVNFVGATAHAFYTGRNPIVDLVSKWVGEAPSGEDGELDEGLDLE
jgi:hypothetical protein